MCGVCERVCVYFSVCMHVVVYWERVCERAHVWLSAYACAYACACACLFLRVYVCVCVRVIVCVGSCVKVYISVCAYRKQRRLHVLCVYVWGCTSQDTHKQYTHLPPHWDNTKTSLIRCRWKKQWEENSISSLLYAVKTILLDTQRQRPSPSHIYPKSNASFSTATNTNTHHEEGGGGTIMRSVSCEHQLFGTKRRDHRLCLQRRLHGSRRPVLQRVRAKHFQARKRGCRMQFMSCQRDF